jgi:hypothetical protein
MKTAQQDHSEQPSLPSSPTSSVKSSLDSVSDIASDISTEPTFESEWSTKARTADTSPIEGLKFKYHSVVWPRLPGFSIPISRRTARLNSEVWRTNWTYRDWRPLVAMCPLPYFWPDFTDRSRSLLQGRRRKHECSRTHPPSSRQNLE